MTSLLSRIPSLILTEDQKGEAAEIFTGEYDVALNRAPVSVLDIGANCGLFTLWARHRWPAASIDAYEPIKENVNTWQSNCPLPFNCIHEVAVSNFTGVSRMQPGHNEMAWKLNAQKGQRLVTTVDSKELPAAEFIKIDAQGSEMLILQNLDVSAALAVVVETHNDELTFAVESLMVCRGFALVSKKLTVPAKLAGGHDCYLLKFRRPDAAPSSVPTVFLGMPVYGGYDPFFISSLMVLMAEQPFNLMIRPQIGDSLVSRARNNLAAQFLATDATHLLFLDTDLIFHPSSLQRMLSHREPVVAGLYAKKQPELAWVFNAMAGQEPDHRGLQRIRYAGTGCLMIERSVIETMRAALPEIEYQPDDGEKGSAWDFFSVGVWQDPVTGLRRFLSEDWYFCQRVLDLGIPIYMDSHVVCRHVGAAVYPLRVSVHAGGPIDTRRIVVSFATRLVSAHTRIRGTFGVDVAGAQWYVWLTSAGAATGTAIPCYQPDGSRGRNAVESALLAEIDFVIHATKSGFASAPRPGQELWFGTTTSVGQIVRIERVSTTLVRPFYRLECVDPQIDSSVTRT